MRVLILLAISCAAHAVGLQPSGFLESQESPHPKPVTSKLDGSEISTPLLIYGSVVCFVATLIVAIFWRQGWTIMLPVMMYIGALSTMTIQLREIFAVQEFNFPRFVTATHFLGAAMVTGIILTVERQLGKSITIINAPTFFRGVLPAAICFTLSLGMANLGIAYTNAHFYEMVEGGTVLITSAILFLSGKPTPLILVSILMVTMMGQSLCWSGELNFSLIGLVLLLLSAVCRSTKGVLNQLLMSSDGTMQSLRPIELTFYNSVTCLFMMGPCALIVEGRAPFHRLATSQFDVFRALLLSVFTACVIQVSGATVIQSIGAVAAQLTGSIKGFLSVLGAWAALGEVITSKQWVGYMIVITSIAAYNRVDSMLKEAAAKKKDECENSITK